MGVFMFRKVIKKLSSVAQRKKSTPPKSQPDSKSDTSQPRLLTAEGWRRQMMKKSRKI